MRHFLTIAALVVLAGCSSNSDPLAPFQPEVTNATDNFQMQATNVTHVTTVKTFTWHNTGTLAVVNHSTTTLGGLARLTIVAPGNATVYDKTLAPSFNDATSAGTSGDWTIKVELTDYSGTINFRVQKQ